MKIGIRNETVLRKLLPRGASKDQISPQLVLHRENSELPFVPLLR